MGHRIRFVVGLSMVLLAACGGGDRRGNGGSGAAGVGGLGGTGGSAGFGGIGGTSGFGGVGGTSGVGGTGGTSGTGGTDAGLPDAGGNDAGDLDAAIGDASAVSDAATSDASSNTDANTTTPPDDDCTAATHAGHSYWFCESNQDWDEARASCQAIGADLVSINDEAENAFVMEQIDAIADTQWLIGINQKNASGMTTAGTWEWVDGTTPTYTQWDSSEPDTVYECGVATTDGWADFSCGNGENWICEVP